MAEQAAEIQRLNEENQRLRAALEAVQNVAEDKTWYYYNLVWRSNKTAEQVNKLCPDFYAEMKERGNYEEFVLDEKSLMSTEDHIRYYHDGFFSGCYASAQLFLKLADTEDDDMGDGQIWTAQYKRQQAFDAFPELDT